MVNIILAGSHRYTFTAYEALRSVANVKIVGILHNPTAPRKVEDKVQNKGFQFQVHDQFKDVPEIKLEEISTIQADVLLSVMYSRILTADQLSLFPQGSWNIHPGILPTYRGRNIIYWTIINGESTQGLTFHQMTPELDAGEILEIETYQVFQTDTAQDIFLRAQSVVGTLATRGMQKIISGSYELQANSINDGQLYTTDSVDYAKLHFLLSDFASYDDAQKHLRALLFPLLQQYPSISDGNQTITVKTVEDLDIVKNMYNEAI